jgi:chromosome segregation ATPase
VWHDPGQPITYDVPANGFLVGSVPGCDLRLPGVDLAPVICLVTPRPHGAGIRKLAPAQGVLVNGRPLVSPLLVNGDEVRLGPVVMIVHVDFPPQQAGQAEQASGRTALPAAALSPAEFEERARQLDERQRQLEDQTRELESDRVIWYERRADMEREAQQLKAQQHDVADILTDIAQRKQTEEQEGSDVTRERAALAEQAEQLARRQDEVEALRKELADTRQQLHESYAQRRDRLAGLQEAVRQAARNVQEHKRHIDAEGRQVADRQREDDARRAEVEARAGELARDRQVLEEDRRALDARKEADEQDLAQRLEACAALENHLETERQALETERADFETKHQADVLRLDRFEAMLEQRQKELEARALEVDRCQEQLTRDSRDLEEQGQQLEEWHKKLCDEAERIAKQAGEIDGRTADLTQRAAAIEGQQAMLATLRTRLERTREDAHREEQQLTEQRTRQEETEAELRRQMQEVQRLRAELDLDQREREEERSSFSERGQAMEKAVAQMHQLQGSLAAEEDRLRQRALDLDARDAAQVEEAALLKSQFEQLADMQQRLATDRQVLRDREAELARTEQARQTLQEQLVRRSEELAERQRALAEQGRQRAADVAALEQRRAEIGHQHQECEAEAGEAQRRREELSRREQALNAHVERLKEAGRKIGGVRKALHEERGRWAAEQQAAGAAAVQAHADYETVRRQALDLQQQQPELELRTQTALDRLGRAREQLRGHVGELHAYARQSHDDLEDLRTQVQAEADRVRQEGVALHRHREEHRLAVAAFRQHLIEWQGQVAEMRRSLAQDETRLERRQAQVEADSARLARQAEQLQEQEREVAEQRDEMGRHLADMREWYRRKLRELSERHRSDADAATETGAANEEEQTVAASAEAATEETPNILALTGDVDPGDRKLGDLLRTLQLIEADTLTALLVEARKQRRSLRQILLASGCVTLYQMALIEAGNLDGLMLGPVRVVDRVRVTPQEAVYHVFDPRRSQASGAGHALLRHLAEAEAQDAVRPDDFRQRFAAAAAVRHPHLAATLEVLEIAGRPAVLQEWLTGLPATDWPALAAAPGVLFRLLCQAALGLHTAHQAGLVHGHLEPALLVLTGDGTLKLCGLGEPTWLLDRAGDETPGNDPAADLLALGRIADGWTAGATARRKGGKTKPLPEPLQEVLHRLSGEAGYANAGALLEDLDRVGAEVPANPEAWDRLLRHVRDQVADDPRVRQSA